VSSLSDCHIFAFDVETTGLNPHDSRLLLLQISTPDKVFVIEAGADIKPLLPFFEDHKWLKIIHNAKFDTKFMYHNYGVPTHNVFDTMLAEQLITSDPYNGISLASVVLKYLHIVLDKSMRGSFIDMKPMEIFSKDQLDYAGKDTVHLIGVYEAQKAKLEEYGLTKVAEVEFELASVVGQMELTGVPILTKKWKASLDEFRVQHEQSRLRMHELIFDDNPIDEQIGMFVRDAINLNSPKQLKEAFNKIGIDIEKTNEREISLVNHPAALELLNYRGLQKLLSSYGESFLDKLHPFTGRIHADFQQIGTATGRFACKDPNLQQMPPSLRACVGLEDYKIVSADYSNIELRILAELSGDDNFGKAFASGADPHKGTASIMFNIPIDDVTKDQRFIAKTINFGISYGMGPNKLMDMLNKGKPKKDQLTFNQVNAIMKKYKESYRGAIDWLQNAGNRAYRQGYSETMLGRRRFYDRPSSSSPDWEGQVASLKRQGANSPIQGTNADITKLAMLNLHHDLKTYNFRADMILQVHDEIGVLAHKSQADAVSLLVAESMERSAQELLKVIPVKVDISIGDVWSK
jgi:DNA polymerase I-like protein with 3'-5' exonuclease and polymerase domains